MGRPKRTTFPHILKRARRKDKRQEDAESEAEAAQHPRVFVPFLHPHHQNHPNAHPLRNQPSDCVESLPLLPRNNSGLTRGLTQQLHRKYKRRRVGRRHPRRDVNRSMLQRELNGAVLTERAISQQIEQRMALLRDSLPLSFLQQAGFRAQGEARALELFLRLYSSRLSFANASSMRMAWRKWEHFTLRGRIREARYHGISRLNDALRRSWRRRVVRAFQEVKKEVEFHRRKEEFAAALQVQRVWRGWEVRGRLGGCSCCEGWVVTCCNQGGSGRREDSAYDAYRAARSIQKACRRYACRVKRRRHSAAVRLQCSWRAAQAKRRVQHVRKENAIALERAKFKVAKNLQRIFRNAKLCTLRDNAATRIQSGFRLFHQRQLLAKHRVSCAIKIQSCWRMRLGKAALLQKHKEKAEAILLHASVQALLRVSTIKIQRAWKKHRAMVLRAASHAAAMQAIHRAEAWTMALRIQNAFRGYQIRRELHALFSRITSQVETSATTISAAVRGWLVRLHAKRSKARKRQETSAAIRLQAQIRMRQLRHAWIDEQHRLKLQSFLYQREENVQRRALRAWRMRIILDRRERDKMMLEKALTHFQNRLLCTSWTSWLRRTKESQRERRLLVFAVGHFRHRLSATTFTTWQKHAEEVVWRRKLLVKIFLCCVQLPAYNSRVMRYKASLAVNYYEIKHLRRGFSRIFQLAREEAARGRKAKAWHERRWEERAPRIAITAWSERTKQFKRSRLAKATADAAAPLFYKRRGLHRLQKNKDSRVTARQHAFLASFHRRKRLQKSAFGTWRKFIYIVKARRRILRDLVISFERDACCLAFQRWRKHHDLLVQADANTLRRVLHSWWTLAHREKALRRAELGHRLLLEYKAFRKEQKEAAMPLPRLPTSSLDHVRSTRVPCLVIITTVWDASTELRQLEARLATELEQRPLPLHVRLHRVEYDRQFKDEFTQLGASKLPAVVVTWKGQTLQVWAQQDAETWRTVSDQVNAALNAYVAAPDDALQEQLFQSMQTVVSIETAAVIRLQHFHRMRHSNALLLSWQKAVAEALKLKAASDLAAHWSQTSWNEYHSASGRPFWFNHHTAESRWDPPPPPSHHRISLFLITTTGYRTALRIRASDTAATIKSQVASHLKLSTQNLRLSIRKRGCAKDGSIVVGANNRRMTAKLGSGSNTPVEDDAAELGGLVEEGDVVEVEVSWEEPRLGAAELEHAVQCNKCCNEPAQWYCEQCRTVVCEACFIEEHEEKAVHSVVPVDVSGVSEALARHGYDSNEAPFCKVCAVRPAQRGGRCSCCIRNWAGPDADSAGIGMRAVFQRWTTPHLARQKEEKAAAEREKAAAEKAAMRKFLTEAFHRHDADGNGTMDKAELRAFLQHELCEPVSAAELQQAVREMDENGDGVIELEELIDWYTRLKSDPKREGLKTRLMRRELQMRKMAKWAADRATLSSTGVPGYPSVGRISVDDYDGIFPLFRRFIRREYTPENVSFGNRDKCIIVFDKLFVPAWNGGKLGNVYYHDSREIQHEGCHYRQLWDEDADCFKFVDLNDPDHIEWINPQLKAQHSQDILQRFNKYDVDASGFLDQAELSAFMREEMCLNLNPDEMEEAVEAMVMATGAEEAANGISFEAFLRWYIQGMDSGESGPARISRSLRLRRSLRGTLGSHRLSSFFSTRGSLLPLQKRSRSRSRTKSRIATSEQQEQSSTSEISPRRSQAATSIASTAKSLLT